MMINKRAKLVIMVFFLLSGALSFQLGRWFESRIDAAAALSTFARFEGEYADEVKSKNPLVSERAMWMSLAGEKYVEASTPDLRVSHDDLGVALMYARLAALARTQKPVDREAALLNEIPVVCSTSKSPNCNLNDVLAILHGLDTSSN